MPEDSGYPESLLRGIRKAKWVDDGVILADAFEPDERTDRKDGLLETSINWEDDEGALEQLLRQPAFRENGAARVRTAHVRYVARSAAGQRRLDFERRPDPEQPDNEYHGNLLFVAMASKQIRRHLAAALAVGGRSVE